MTNETNSKTIVRTERRGAVAVVAMDLSPRLSVLSVELLDALNGALTAVSNDPSIRSIILCGVGRSFSVGGDLTQFRADFDRAPATADRMVGRFHACIRTIRDAPKPVIAALQGAIAGGGFSLALACDLGVAADDATFLSAYTRLGTNPDGGGTWFLTRMLGVRRALEVMLLNETITAQRAFEFGLVNRVVPADKLDEAVNHLANQLAAESAGTMASVKRLVQAATVSTLGDQLDCEKAGFVDAAGKPDFREGVSAFFERRVPRFA